MKLKSDSLGRLAIYTDGNDTPLTNPTTSFSRLKFHSDLEYINIIDVISGSVTLPARAANNRYTQTHNGPAHGRSGIPFVMGFLNIGGTNVAFAGSVPVFVASGRTRLLSLGASSSRLLFHEQTVCSSAAGVSSLSVSYTVYVTDEVL